MNANPRKSVRDNLVARMVEVPPEGMTLQTDGANPYAFVVEVAGPNGPRKFRVVVKELA